MIEDFLNAIQNFRTNKTRTFLSLLGIVIGVTSVVIVTTMGNSLYQSLASQFDDFSMDVVSMYIQWNRTTNKPYVIFNDAFRENLIKEIPEIKNIFYASEFDAYINRGNLTAGSKNVSALEPGRCEALKIELDYGSYFNSSDYVNGFQKAIIGDAIAEELFPEGSAIGKKITIQINSSRTKLPPYNFEFEVIGVLKPKNNWLIRTSQAVFVPRQFYKNQLASVGNDTEVRYAEVLLFNADDGTIAEEKIKAAAQELGGGYPYAVWTFSAQNEFEKFSKIMDMVRMVVSSIAGISLLVGGIGIMNIMLVTVTERKKEIGIRKALGASNAAIRNQFLVESASLTLTGGGVGVVLGMILAKIIIKSFFPADFVFSFNIDAILIAFSVSVGIGVFFGLHPAIKAAKLDPVVALAE